MGANRPLTMSRYGFFFFFFLAVPNKQAFFSKFKMPAVAILVTHIIKFLVKYNWNNRYAFAVLHLLYFHFFLILILLLLLPLTSTFNSCQPIQADFVSRP